MSAGFGFSVGDFLAAIKLVGTVIDSLRESSDATSSFRAVIDELYALETALLHVKRLNSDISHVQQVALLQAASQCQQTIDRFYLKIQKYQPHLQKGGTDSAVKDAWAKVKWVVCKKDEVEKFRSEIRGHTSSIQILLLTVQMEAITTHNRAQNSQNERLGHRIQSFSCRVMSALTIITKNVSQGVQQMKALLESSTEIVQTNIRIFQVVHDIQLHILRLPAQVQRQQPVYLIDPFNRESPFHLEFIKSKEALLAVMKENLRDTGCGPRMINQGLFVFEELGTQLEIDLTDPWESCFYPGQKVAMSMVFKQKKQASGSSSCPRCFISSQEPAEKETTCIHCGTVYRRTTIFTPITLEDIRLEETSFKRMRSNALEDILKGNISEKTKKKMAGLILNMELIYLLHLIRDKKKPPKEPGNKERDDLINLQKFRRIRVVDFSPN